ncbi:NUDIX domain-containing protein [Streptomyces sp. T028]|uniref:NUDIX domain-containing protein n=1 Tax=Streptomyces sp. T028 TaxID=3394379 RepID=UPI003A891F61
MSEPSAETPSPPAPPAPPTPGTVERGTVVAVALTWRGRVGLFKRGARVGHDAGLWHCVTGFVEDGNPTRAEALRELFEETGLAAADLTGFRPGPVLDLADTRGGAPTGGCAAGSWPTSTGRCRGSAMF